MESPQKMMSLGCFLLLSLLAFSSCSHGAGDARVRNRRSLTLSHDLSKEYKPAVDDRLFGNSKLKQAYAALQAWKSSIYSDPMNFTSNWVGYDVCAYNGVVCAKAPYNDSLTVVAGVDLNHADIAGHLPDELGNLSDVTLLHLNSNRFCGIVPKSFMNLKLLFELDLSNNRFVGPFPEVVLGLPELKFLDLRFNDFEGALPPELFSKDLDAIFLNNNRFYSTIPETLGKSQLQSLCCLTTSSQGASQAALADGRQVGGVNLVGQ
ncbi:Leucine-rich repeat extensin-like protein 3 [Sesamum angolense]|uniref:Cell wall hydroxyproline-rich glycoprotein n=1 Tax=Sesamum angolense TaxID=2727404 RepID=A0AAE2BXR2_9LAMI|nr:Leucine-rich repeat extensin-like protein 3 [Sesamum angolense]